MDNGSWKKCGMNQADLRILCTGEVNKEVSEYSRSKAFQFDIIPFIRTEFVQSDTLDKEIEEIKGRIKTVAFTSMTAVEAVNSKLIDAPTSWKIFSTGNTTSKLVMGYFGESCLHGTAANAVQLAQLVLKDKNTREVIFFCGDQRRDEFPEILRSHGIEVKEIIVYRTIPLQHHIDQDYDAILFFSPSAVKSFFINNDPSGKTVFFAIGETTAAQLRTINRPNNKIIVSQKGKKEDLVKLSMEYLINERDEHRSENISTTK